MSSTSVRFLLAWGLVSMLLSSGCGQGSAPPAAATAPAANAGAVADDEVAQALAKLEPADRQAAEKQVNCPVSEHALGSMGPPIKVSHDGQAAFLCCEGCKEEFDKDPATFLAKLKQ